MRSVRVRILASACALAVLAGMLVTFEQPAAATATPATSEQSTASNRAAPAENAPDEAITEDPAAEESDAAPDAPATDAPAEADDVLADEALAEDALASTRADSAALTRPAPGRPYLAFEVKNTSGTRVPGATVAVQGPRAGTSAAWANRWTESVAVQDCTSAPCDPASLDQDATPGVFAVDRLTAAADAPALSATGRYRIGASSVAPIGYRWTTGALTGRTDQTAEVVASIPAGNNVNTAAPNQWVQTPNPSGGMNAVHTFVQAPVLDTAPSLAWEVVDGTGTHIGGATINVRGPRVNSSNWSNTYRVQDCTAEPCAAISMDQDPRPGFFRVHSLRIGTSSGSAIHDVSQSSRYGISPYASPVGYQWVSPSSYTDSPSGGWQTPSYRFPALSVAEGAFLAWEVRDEQERLVAGATVEVQGPRDRGAWGASYYVTDCDTNPCHPESMDQDPTPGIFQVDTLRGISSSQRTAVDVQKARYQIRPMGSIPGHQWSTSVSSWIPIPQLGSAQDTPNWPANELGYRFAPLKVTSGRAASKFCTANDGKYFSLKRASTSSGDTSILSLAPNANDTGIMNSSSLVARSGVTLVDANHTANSLGITPSGVFYFTGQYGGATNEQQRAVTIYRFDPESDARPYPVFQTDLLSPTSGTLVSGDATVYQGREEFYYAYYSDSPVTIDGRTAIRFHLYRYSHGNGDRTGEVHHIDVPRAANWGSGMNGDFSFDAQNNLQFIISDSGGRVTSGVVNVHDFQPYPSAHTLADVTSIRGTANFSANSSLSAINGIAYTKSGRAILQRNAGGTNANFLADMPGLTRPSAQQNFRDQGSLVDLASCSTPTTVTVQKVVAGGRYASDDQFTLQAQRVAGATTDPFSPVTTTGDLVGLQKDQLGPFVTTLDGTFEASETIPANSERYTSTWECHALAANGTALPSFASGEGRSLRFPLSGSNAPAGVVPGSELVCVFTNTLFAPDLKVSKTSEPESGTLVHPGEHIRYVLTFDNRSGTAATGEIAYTDWLGDVLDDATVERFAGGETFQFRSSTSGEWSASAPANFTATDRSEATGTMEIAGVVPAGEVRQVSFQVLVRPNSAERAGDAESTVDYVLRNFLTPSEQTEPPSACEENSDELPLCAEHPIQAWTVSKESRPADGARLHKGGNAHYRLVADKLTAETTIAGLVFRDDLTDVFLTAGFAPNAAVPGGALARGVYFFDAAGNSLAAVDTPDEVAEVNGPSTAPVAALGVEAVPAPSEVDGRWILESAAVHVPSNAVRAELWFAVQAAERPADLPASWPKTGPNGSEQQPKTGDRFTNYATASASNQAPTRCDTATTPVPQAGGAGADDRFPAECQVTHELQDNYFTIRKDASGPAVDAINVTRDSSGKTVVTDPRYGSDITGMWNMVGHTFSVRDDIDGSPSDYESVQLCRAEYHPIAAENPTGEGWNGLFTETAGTPDWEEGSATLQAILDWNNSIPDGQLKLPLCALLYAQENAGGQTGRWRSEHLPEGDYWLVETRAPHSQITTRGDDTRAVPGIQLLAEPIGFRVWGEQPGDPFGSSGQSQHGSGQLDVAGQNDRCEPGGNVEDRPTACVNPTGYLMLVQDPSPAPLPLTGGQWLSIVTLAGAAVLLSATVIGIWLRRRQAQAPAEVRTV